MATELDVRAPRDLFNDMSMVASPQQVLDANLQAQQPDMRGNFHSARMGPEAIAQANGLSVQAKAPEISQAGGIQTGFGGLAYQAQNVGIALEAPPPGGDSVFSFGITALETATSEIRSAIEGPGEDFTAAPRELEVAGLDGPPVISTPVNIPTPGMRTV